MRHSATHELFLQSVPSRQFDRHKPLDIFLSAGIRPAGSLCMLLFVRNGFGNVVHNAVHVFPGPFNQSLQMRHKASAAFGQAVFHPRRDFGKYLPCHQTEIFKTTKRHGQHPLLYGDYGPLDVVESHRAVCIQAYHNQHGPFIP